MMKGSESVLFDFFERFKKVENEKEIDEQKNNPLNIEAPNISKEEVELAEKLDAIQEFSIDRFEENIAVLENRDSGEILNIELENLPEGIKEGDILKCINGKYVLDKEKTEEEAESIKEQMDSLWD